MNKKLLTFYNLILTVILTIFGLANSHSSQEVIYALSFAPMALFFGLITFGRQSKTAVAPRPLPLKRLTPAPKETVLLKEEIGIADIDKRAFLRLIGAAGLSFFLFSIFSKRGEASFFGNAIGSGTTSLSDSAGNKINPAEKQSTDGYSISEIDDDVIAYYGFTHKDGTWYIMKKDENTGSIRYSRGANEFPGNWDNRKNLNYDYFSNVF